MLDDSAFECGFGIVGFALGGEMCDEFPTRNFQPFSMFLDLWSLETKPLSNDQHHTTADPRSLDIADFFVARALDLFSRLAVNHHRTGADDDFDFLGRRLVLHTGSIQAKLFFDALYFRRRRDVSVQPELTADHIANQHTESLRCPSRGTDWATEFD